MSVSPHTIRTGACLIIGDEVLNGKILDTNSKYFAKYCFKLGIDVRHMSVVPDVEQDIVEEVRRLSSKYDLVVTSGGIGPTHDDITYESIAKAVELPLVFHQTTADKMARISKFVPKDEAAKKAQWRMATFPSGPNVECYYPSDDLWVPVVTIDSKIHILPGVPRLFEKLLDGLTGILADRVDTSNLPIRYFVNLKDQRESNIAPFLTQLQNKFSGNSIKLGSYPHMESNSITVSIIGPESEKDTLRDIVADVQKELGGTELTAEQEALQK